MPKMTKLEVQQFFERQNLNLECASHVIGAHQTLTDMGLNPPSVNTMLGWKRC